MVSSMWVALELAVVTTFLFMHLVVRPGMLFIEKYYSYKHQHVATHRFFVYIVLSFVHIIIAFLCTLYSFLLQKVCIYAHRNHQLLTTIRCLSTVIFHVNCMACTHGRSVTLTSPGQPGLSFVRACMTSQSITSWGLSSNGITSLCPTSWHTPSTRRDSPKGWVCPLVIYKEVMSRTVVREVLPRAATN